MEFDSLAMGTSGYVATSIQKPVPPAVSGKVYSAEESAHIPQGQGVKETKKSDGTITKMPARSEKTTEKTEKTAEKEVSKELRVSEEDIDKIIATANKKIEPLYLELQYRIHSKTNQLMVSVINTSTKEVVREIPPEKTLDALAKMWELVGILIDKKG